MKNILALVLAVSLVGCSKDDKTFSLKSIRLNDYRKANLPAQKLHLEVYDGNTPMTYTDTYPSDFTLPATFAVHPAVPMTLYNSKAYQVQLWGDSTGYMGSCNINMDEYKIIFPIDMEVKNESLSVSIMGSWK